MSNLLRLVACLFLCVSLNSFGANVYFLSGTSANYLNSFDTNTGEVTVGTENLQYRTHSNHILGVNKASLTYADGNLLWQAGNSSNASIIKYDISTGTHSKLIDNNVNVYDAYYGMVYGNNNTAYFLNGASANYLNSFDINTGEVTVGTENLQSSNSTGTNSLGTSRQSLTYANGNLFWQAGYGWQASIIKYDISTGTNSKLIENNTNVYDAYYGMVYAAPVPLPAGIYLFLSGLVGLGLMRGRNA